jgi:extracellular elastinolytic metalloproteinase
MAATVVLVALVSLPAPAGAVAPPEDQGGAARSGPRPFFDVRQPAIDRATRPNATAPRELPADDRAARRRLVRGLGRQAVLDADPLTATPRVLGKLNGTLTGPRAGDPADVALDYVRERAPALGLSEGDLTGLRLAARHTARGVTHLRWQQVVRGVPAYDNDLRVNVDGDGRVINVLGTPRHALSVDSVTPALSAGRALEALQRNVGIARAVRVTSTSSNARRTTRFSTGDMARLVLFGDVRTVRLAWHLTYDAGPTEWYDAVVDATTGRVLRRSNLVKAIDARVFDNYPGAPRGGEQRTVSLDAYLSDTTRLFGPFAHTWSDVDDSSGSAGVEAPSAGEDVEPGPYAQTDFTAENPGGACLAAARCSWNHTVPNSWQANRRQNAVQAHWYTSHFHDHLAAPPISFAGTGGNFEDADRVLVQTDDGATTAGGLPNAAHVDNANFGTPPDGQSPRMQMYLFMHDATPTTSGGQRSPFRDANGADHAAIVYHEYTHGLSNRLITDADGAGALNSPQSAAMGEGWSDWYAEDLLVAEGHEVDTAAPGEIDIGRYVDAVPHQIRTQGLDCAVGSDAAACPGPVAPRGGTAGSGGYTYGDFAKVRASGAQEHGDGEIWGETLWDLRGALGSATAQAVITEGMRLTPPEPSFLDARNAILQADQALFGGVHVSGIWGAFTARGMGFFAGTEDASDVAPVESFAPPPAADAPTGQISGRVTDSDSGRPLEGIVVGVGGLATAPSAFTATTAADGTYTIGPLPAGTYPVLTFRGGVGYERRSSRAVTVEAGATRTLDMSLRRNWSALAGGARVSETNDDSSGPFGCGVDQAIDGDPGTGWSAFVPTSAGAFGIVNPHRGVAPTMTVELPAAVDVSAFGIDPSNTCGDDVTSATKDLRIEVSSDGTTFATALEHSFGAEDRGRLNVIDAGAAATGVRFVRVTLLSNQRPAGAGGAGVNFVDLSELAVYGASQLADPPPGETPPPAPGDTAPAGPPAGETPPADPAPADPPPGGSSPAEPPPADPAPAEPPPADPAPAGTPPADPAPEPAPSTDPAPAGPSPAESPPAG